MSKNAEGSQRRVTWAVQTGSSPLAALGVVLGLVGTEIDVQHLMEKVRQVPSKFRVLLAVEFHGNEQHFRTASHSASVHYWEISTQHNSINTRVLREL